jgi:molecular chaperone GrpE
MSEDKSTGNGAAETPDNELDKTKAELEKAKRDYLYLLAEFDNYRKNSIKERSDLTKYGSEKFIREFLGIFDNFERALETEVKSENLQTFREGVQMIAGELRTLLHRFGVEALKAEGEAFDPNKHEALSSEPRDDIPPGHVAQVFRKGYKRHDKLIRPAQVTVAQATGDKNEN